jgi:hypothetical protein
VEHVRSAAVRHAAGRSWTRIPVPALDADGALLLVIPRTAGVRVPLTDCPAPYGVLVQLRREPRSITEDAPPPTNEWSAAEHRGRTVGLRLATPRAYSAERARGGYARPFDGPQLWSAAGPAGALTAEWDEPRELARVELVFNDDVDADLINLHHHRTEPPVMPELVRDYRLEARVDGVWRELVEVIDNRVRRRVHVVAPIRVDALRLTVTTTNGSPWATVHAVRAYNDPDPRLLRSGAPLITTR